MNIESTNRSAATSQVAAVESTDKGQEPVAMKDQEVAWKWDNLYADQGKNIDYTA